MKHKKKVLVVGSTGAMGQYLVPELAKMGYLVDAVSLDEEKPYNENVTCIKANAKDKAFLEPLLTAKHYDGIVDFMIYWDHDFPDYYRLFLDNTDHYVFLSTYRIYADEEHPVKESSPRLLDVSADKELTSSNDYCIHKAKDEDTLKASEYANYTIVRPAITYSLGRYQLVTLEAPNTVGRARAGKKVLLPKAAKNVMGTMSWAGDVAKMIARLLFKEEAMKETYTVTTAEHHTWGEIAEYYERLTGLQIVWGETDDYIYAAPGDNEQGKRWQLEYDRLFDRTMDNSKILAVTGLKQEELMPLFDGLKYEISRLPENALYPNNDKMDEILKKYE